MPNVNSLARHTTSRGPSGRNPVTSWARPRAADHLPEEWLLLLLLLLLFSGCQAASCGSACLPPAPSIVVPTQTTPPGAHQSLRPAFQSWSQEYRSQSPDDSPGRLFDPATQQFYVDEQLAESLGQRQVVKDVIIEGNRRVPTPEISRLLKTRPGRYFDPDLLQQDVQAIWRMTTIRRVHGPFLNQSEDGLTVTFQVEEHPFIAELKFVGNRALSDSYLKRETGLEEGKPLNDFEVRMARDKIEQLYQSRGHAYTSVERVKTDDPSQVIFVIYEDKRRKVNSVSFEGNTIASSARLGVIVKTKPQRLWLFGGNLDRELLDRDVDLLTAYYFSLGFFNAKIGREITSDPQQSNVDVKFVINEGPRYRVRNIRLEGVTQYSQEELLDLLKLKPDGDQLPFFNADAMNEDVMTLRDTYGSVGHIFADVQAQPHFQSEPGLIDLVYRIDEGKPYRVGRVNVHIDGDGITRRNVVINRVTLKPGDLIDIRKVRQSERLLRASELFGDPQNPSSQPRIVIRPPEEELLDQR